MRGIRGVSHGHAEQLRVTNNYHRESIGKR